MSHSDVKQLIHLFWSTKNERPFIDGSIKNELYAYLTTIVKSKNGKVICCGGSTDHIHLLILLPPEISLSSLIGHVKSCTSKLINAKQKVFTRFEWQEGFNAFSTEESRLNSASIYIKTDDQRHRSQNKSYRDELLNILDQQKIKFNEQFFLNNSHSKIYIHAIWSTHKRLPYLVKEVRNELYPHITSTISSCKGTVYAIGGVEDHIHILMDVPKNMALSDFIKEIKTVSTHWIKKNFQKQNDFNWQTGYAAYSLSPTTVKHVMKYINNQEEHHKKQSFFDEWNEFLAAFKPPHAGL